jgi:cell pole-organizing protein PopZ
MTKPQFASEPSMEDILASIRKMISDDRSPTRPRPDPMTRTPFAEVSSPAPVEPGATAATVARSGPSYGSLSEAIKAAAQPADQRRTLEERITDLLEKGGTGSADPLAALAHRAQPAPAAPSRPSAPAASLSSQSASSSAVDSALPFGTRAPQAPTAAPAVTPATTAAPETNAEPQRVIAMPSRYPSAPATSTPAPAANGQLNGTSVASFGSRVGTNGAQPVRATPPAEEPVAARTAMPAAEPALDTLKAYDPAPADVVKGAIGEPAPAMTPAAPSEALVDAMIELVKNEPASLSVFTSGAAFMKGVSEKGIGVEKSLAAHKQAPAVAPAHSDDGAPELDGAAAELLRPMLRQWLAENMPRIVEAALRSELTIGGKGPGKA